MSEQYQGRFPNATLGDNYPVQGFLSDARIEQSQQLQKILPDTRCVGSHPAHGLPLTQRSQPQEMPTSDMLLLTQQAWGPLSAVAYKDTQPLKRCVYPPTPLTQGTVPCTASQSAQKPVTSALFTQPHQSHGLLPGSGQKHIQGALLINSRESQTSQQDATSLPNQGTQVPISGAVSTQILQHRVLPSGNVYLQERQMPTIQFAT